MQTGGPWVEPPDATVVIWTGFTGWILYPETGITCTTQEMNYFSDIPGLQTLEATLLISGGIDL